MRRIAVLSFFVVFTVLGAFAKKDMNAWKKEQGLEKQYEVFKENLNFWNGSYFMKPLQLDEFYTAMKGSVAELEKVNRECNLQISDLRNELNVNQAKTKEIQENLDESIKHQESIVVFGLLVHKNTYAVILYSIIIGLLVLAAFAMLLFKRSNKITVRTQKDYKELKQEYEEHKKNALDRYTKMNMELHRTRLELNKK